MSTLFSRKLRELRRFYGLSQRAAALRLGISPQCYAHYEAGRRTPDVFLMYAMAQMYQVTMEYLLCEPEIKEPTISPDYLLQLSGTDLTIIKAYFDYIRFRASQNNERSQTNDES